MRVRETKEGRRKPCFMCDGYGQWERNGGFHVCSWCEGTGEDIPTPDEIQVATSERLANSGRPG